MTRKPLPCFCCGGNGKGFLRKDRDAIEGYKCAMVYTCLFCEGEETIKPTDCRYEAVKAYYTVCKRMETEHAKKRMLEKHARELARAKALKKLNAEDKKALGITED